MRAILLLFPLFPALSRAAETGADIPSASFFQASLALAFIVGLLFLLAFLGHKFFGSKGFGHGRLKLMGGVNLGPRERIVLVEAGESILVVGIVPGQIRTLHCMPRSEIAVRPEDAQAPHSPTRNFTQILQKIVKPRSDEKK
ncbi:MAG: flagellar biosynthetic protein FliO [Zoogloeaceae bacterium]|jgi:flagellar protein FliO/FliZ|nr:flagellar biosynthetic protein FliO [Zoogloeaceae bacterium]